MSIDARRFRTFLYAWGLAAACALVAIGCDDESDTDAGTAEDAGRDSGTQDVDAGSCADTNSCPRPGCADLRASGDCPAHRSCDEAENGSGTCLPSCDDGFLYDATSGLCDTTMCAPEHAMVPGSGPLACVACDLGCDGPGEAGLYAATNATGECVCATSAGYYWSPSLAQARACDADQDGWISRSAWAALTGADAAIRAVAETGCATARVDRVVLANEYGQQKTIHVCGTGLAEEPCTETEGGASWLPLVEPDANDDQVLVDAQTQRTPAPSGGRRLRARELSAVTKACVSAAADFDGDGVFDVAASQAGAAAPDRADRWRSFAYFVELHASEYLAPVGDEPAGRFVITERSRAEPSFPMGYADGAGTYWRDCSRQRDARWTAQSTDPGFDFAQWTSRLDPSVPMPPIVATPGAGQPPAPHGLDDLALPWSGGWRGMTHHSQFKCVLVDDSAERPTFAAPVAAFAGDDGFYDFQRCTAEPAVDGEAPTFSCAQETASVTRVGWAAVRYTDAPLAAGDAPLSRVAGCVDESIWRASTPSICPSDTPTEADGFPSTSVNADDFGLLVCACDASDPNRHPGMADPLDDAFADSNCDGVDGDASSLVFVAVDGSDAAGCGTRAAPCRTIGRGIVVAGAANLAVAVSEGTYDERVVMMNGVSVYGGFSRANGWARSASYQSTIASTSVQNAGQTTAFVESVLANGITTATKLDRLRVATPSAPSAVRSVSVYGVRVVGSPALQLSNLVVSSGNATSGATGATGATGGSGNWGGSASGRSGGGGAGAVAGWAPWSAGGRGGDGGGDNIGGACGGTYAPQAGSPPPNRGWCSVGGAGSSAYSCTDPNATGGGSGSACGEGGGGSGASANTAIGGVTSSLWTPAAGYGNGGSGSPGNGGSGGGGGGGGDADTCVGGADGGGGGGGGGGGWGGGPGAGGTGGGSSIALFVVDSSGVAITSSSFTSGAGGAGGSGGTGGSGGSGGGPGSGTGGSQTGRNCGGTIFPTSDPRDSAGGGSGGWGSYGGRGGGGQGGPGGPSVAIAICRSTISGSPTTATGAGGAGGGGGWPNGPSGPSGGSTALLSGCSL